MNKVLQRAILRVGKEKWKTLSTEERMNILKGKVFEPLVKPVVIEKVLPEEDKEPENEEFFEPDGIISEQEFEEDASEEEIEEVDSIDDAEIIEADSDEIEKEINSKLEDEEIL